MDNPAFSGLAVSAIIVLAIIVVILGLVLIAKLKPNSAVGKDVSWAEAKVAPLAAEAHTWGKLFVTDAEALAAGFKRIEPVLQTELQSVLTAAEKRLMDTSSEDAKIAQAQTDTADANAAKALKLQLVKTHVETLQAHIAANTPAA